MVSTLGTVLPLTACAHITPARQRRCEHKFRCDEYIRNSGVLSEARTRPDKVARIGQTFPKRPAIATSRFYCPFDLGWECALKTVASLLPGRFFYRLAPSKYLIRTLWWLNVRWVRLPARPDTVEEFTVTRDARSAAAT